MSEDGKTDKRQSIVQSLPSDYSDVQPKNYDPEFISAISNRMQVPDTIPVMNGDTNYSRLSQGWGDNARGGHDMNVPERIMLAGGGQHIGARPEISNLNFDNLPRADHPEYVGLLTPPRTLTLEEQFPVLDDAEEEQEATPRKTRVPNGTMVAQPVPYTPGMSMSDSLLLNEEDEATQLRTQVSKLTRRVTLMEKEQHTQANREMMMYSATFGYFMLKLLYWFFRPK